MRDHWHVAWRSVKRSFLSHGRRDLAGETIRVTYESRHPGKDEDYLVLKDLARGKRCVFDVGACDGMTSILMARVLGPSGSVYAFEASEESCEVIRENVALNGLDSRVRVINAVVADRSGAVLEFYRGARASHRKATIIAGTGLENALSKATIALDDFAAQIPVSPDFVKIDVEGAERQVLAGMSRLLSEIRPVIALELHSSPGISVSDNAAAIQRLLRAAGYSMLDRFARDPIGDPRVLEGSTRTHVVLVPETPQAPDRSKAVKTSPLRAG
jgi:FkbM family methyltransferase